MPRVTWALLLLSLLALLVMSRVSCRTAGEPIRIGYSTQTAVLCHLGAIFENTDVLKRHHLEASLVRIKRGNEQTDLLQRHEIDVSFNSDVPTILNIQGVSGLKLLAPVGELGFSRLLVKASAPWKGLKDLRGKIGVKKNSVSHRLLLAWLAEEGLLDRKVVEIVDLPGRDDWRQALVKDQCVAVATWDPVAAELMSTGQARSLREGAYKGQAVVTSEYLAAHGRALADFRTALREAMTYLREHTAQVDEWAATISGIPVASLRLGVGANRYAQGKAPVESLDFTFDRSDADEMEACARYAREQALTPVLVTPQDHFAFPATR